jgi:hypothetical protein
MLNYNCEQKLVILTLYNHVLVYSLDKKILIFVGEAQNKNPYFIEKSVMRKQTLYFIATDQHFIYSINIPEAINAGAINNYTKFKLPPEVFATDLAINNTKLVALCTDYNLRVWDCDTANPLKGAAL